MATPSADTLIASAKKSVGGAAGEAFELIMPRLSTVRDLVASLAEHESTDPAHIVVVRRGKPLNELLDALMMYEVNGRVEVVYIVRGNPSGSITGTAVAGPTRTQLPVQQRPSEAYRELFATHVLESVYKWLHLQDIIEGLPQSRINLGGTAQDPLPRFSFGPTASFEVQLLGSESYDSVSWLQARCQAAQGIHPGLLQASTALRDLGIFEFATDRLEQGGVHLWEGNWMAMVACGVLGSKAYYSCPTGPYGAASFLITDDSFRGRVPEIRYDGVRIMRTIGEGLQLLARMARLPPADALRCVEAFVAARGGVISTRDGDNDNSRLQVIQANGEDVGFLKVVPDGRILEMGAGLQPNPANVDMS